MPGTSPTLSGSIPPVGTPSLINNPTSFIPSNPSSEEDLSIPTLSGPLATRRESTTIKNQNRMGGFPESNEKEEEKLKLKQFVDDDGHFSLVRNFRQADLITLMNGVCGSLSLFSTLQFLTTGVEDWLWASIAFPLGGLMFDFLDGKVARYRGESSMLGQELDSLADLVSFGVAPSLLAYSIGLRTPLDILCLTSFICCGIARLARFNATVALLPSDSTGKSKFFEGLPIPSSLFLVGWISYLVKQGWVEVHVKGGKGGLPWGLVGGEEGVMGWELHWFAVVWAGWAAAMISKTLKIPKI